MLGLLNEIWTWKYIIQLNLWHCWISGTVEGDENVKRDKTIDFVALLNMWDFEWNYTVESNKTSKFVHFWIDENVKRDKTVKFVTLLNIWNGLMRWECKTR